jgi:hypothetical protein
VLQFALDPLVAPARVLSGQADDQLSHVLVQRWSDGLVVRVVQAPATIRRCQRSSVFGLTKNQE